MFTAALHAAAALRLAGVPGAQALPGAQVLPEAIEPYLVLMIAGFAVAILGHLARSRWLVAAGIIMIFLAALGFPIALQILSEEPPPPGPQVPPMGPG